MADQDTVDLVGQSAGNAPQLSPPSTRRSCAHAGGFRVEFDPSRDMLVCGDKKVEARAVAPWWREEAQLGSVPLDPLASHLAEAARIVRGGELGRGNP